MLLVGGVGIQQELEEMVGLMEDSGNEMTTRSTC
jgi:hypothetical protein